MKHELKYPENVETTLRRIDEKIEETKGWYEKLLPYAPSKEEYEYFNRSYCDTIHPYLAQKARIIESSCPKMIITAETAEEIQEILKRMD